MATQTGLTVIQVGAITDLSTTDLRVYAALSYANAIGVADPVEYTRAMLCARRDEINKSIERIEEAGYCKNGRTLALARPHAKPAPKPEPDTEAVELPNNVSKDAWDAWVRHRRQNKKPLTQETIKRQVKMLSEQPDPDACINQSIEAGWTGLFPLRNFKRIGDQPSKPGNDYDGGYEAC